MALDTSAAMNCIPDWVPDDVRRYLAHTEEGQSIRALARAAGCHASTILRQVRRCETRREDMLVDLAIDRMASGCILDVSDLEQDRGSTGMIPANTDTLPDTETIEREAPRLLRRLNEPGACLAIAKDMAKAVVVRENKNGDAIRTAVADRPIAEAMALKEWIALDANGRIARYRITASGRVALKGFLAQQEAKRTGLGAEQACNRTSKDASTPSRGRARYAAAESPLLTLSKRLDKSGKPFLNPELVAAGERLREDFELGQMSQRVAQNWDRFLAGGELPGGESSATENAMMLSARARVTSALADLGPGLGDVVLRCCCYLEGMEAVERRMGWSARSGKIVFRIALTRLRRHYDETLGNWSPMIG